MHRDPVLISTKQLPSNSLDQQLIQAAKKHDDETVKALLERGANPNYVKRFRGGDNWSPGRTTTALFEAVSSDTVEINEKKLANTVEILLKSKANSGFQSYSGSWNHSFNTGVFDKVLSLLNKMRDKSQKIRLIRMFGQQGVNLNGKTEHGRDKGHRKSSYEIPYIFYAIQLQSQYSLIKRMQDQFDKQVLLEQKQISLKNMFNEVHNLELETQQIDQGEEQIIPKTDCSQIETELLEEFLKFGVNPDAYSVSKYWQNMSVTTAYQNQYTQIIEDISETLLHRAIMNDCPKIVKLLLENGADINLPFIYTHRIPQYSQKWSEKVRIQKKIENQQKLLDAICDKKNLLDALERQALRKEQKERNIQNPQQQQMIQEHYQQEHEENNGEEMQEDESYVEPEITENEAREYLMEYDLQIYKGKKFVVEDDIPYYHYKNRELSCFQLAQKLNISDVTKQLLKKEHKRSKQNKD